MSAPTQTSDGRLKGACERLLELLESEARALGDGDVARVAALSEEKASLLKSLRQQIEKLPHLSMDDDLEAVARQCQRQNAINGVTLGLARRNHMALLRTLRDEDAPPVYAPEGSKASSPSRSLGSA